ncbi:MAG: Rieske (2Fe-2S) protein [Gammaproteobacteria bacterium]|nr:Rieske (2Fe-2S) protein [Gammaproteobacteria bacterium]
MRQKICDLKDLAELSGKEFIVKNDAFKKEEAFLIYYMGNCYAYENSCPHTGVNLNWQDEQFFSFDGRFLQCSLHGALFEPTTGACVRGPCQGQELKRIRFIIENGGVYTL